MSSSTNDIQRSLIVLMVVVLGMVSMLSVALWWSLNVMQENARRVTGELIPVQQELQLVSESVATAFSWQARLNATTSTPEVNALSAKRPVLTLLDARLISLSETLQTSSDADATRVSRELPALRQSLQEFHQRQDSLLQSVQHRHELREDFDERVTSSERAILDLKRSLASLTGRVRLEYIAAIRDADSSALRRDTLQKITRGDARIKQEKLGNAQALATELGLIVGKIGLSHEPDELHSILANEVTPTLGATRRLFEDLTELMAARPTELASLKKARRQLDQVYLDSFSPRPESMLSLRHKILKEVAAAATTRLLVERSGVALRENTASVDARVVSMVKGLERDAKRSVSTAQWLGLLAALLTLGASLLAGLRIRTAVQGLHVTNDELEALSTNLADANATLEHKVEARTLALAKRETSVRRLLDGLEEGVVSMNPDGTLRQERSLAVERWFGPQTSATQHAWSYFFSESEDQQALLEMGLEQIQDGFLPFELCVDQLPARTHFQDRVYQIRYQPEYLDGSLEAILMILTDVTAMLEAERLQKEARCFQELIERALCDPCGFQQFLQGGEVLLESLKRTEEEATVKHVLHTLKGNSAIFGFEPMAELCHEIEDALEEREVALLMGPELQRLALLWDSMRKRIAVFLEDRNDACVILRHEIQAWRAAIERGEDPADLLRQLDTWLLEPTRVNLERVAQHTHRLARRMGHEIEVDIQSHGVYTEPGFAKEVWNEAIHLIRNALVHGIESETEREQLGKPTRGKITLATDLDEDRALHIRISDDGRGIDWERLSERAQALGLPHETEEDLTQVLFADGVSTHAGVDELAGRGVGTSAVLAACRALGGNISVSSIPKQGTSFQLHVPLCQTTRLKVEEEKASA